MTASIEHLNADCTCVTLDRDTLCKAAEDIVGDPAFCRELARTHPHLFSAQPLFLSAAHADCMKRIILAIERVAKLPAYRERVLAGAPAVAGHDSGAIGLFMGYDFHLGPEGPRLIEINTNAGGALLNAYLLLAQRSCCPESRISQDMRAVTARILDTFMDAVHSEWRRSGIARPLRSIAIVDQAPQSQYLYPEFVLFQRLFASRGFAAFIAAPEDLAHRGGALRLGDERIDLVYNRLTDFALAGEDCAALRSAYLANDAVVSPNPRAHALFANKHNLALLSNAQTLRTMGAGDDDISALTIGIPATTLVTGADAVRLWAERNEYFFKPASGYGGKAAYRGDKVTKKVWSGILAGDYVAQAVVPPSSRTISIDGHVESLKADLRNYTYDGGVQLVAARLYQGQTTNFRTPGGGFAPVFVGDAEEGRGDATPATSPCCGP